MHRVLVRSLLAAAVATATVLVALQPGALAFLLPALLLALPLLVRRYPGERALVARLSQLRQPRRVRPHSASLAPRPLRALMPRGGLLLACAMAVRPPPRTGFAYR